MLTWKIVEASKASLLYIYIYRLLREKQKSTDALVIIDINLFG